MKAYIIALCFFTGCLVALKLCGILDWSWWLVFVPVWAAMFPYAIIIAWATIVAFNEP